MIRFLGKKAGLYPDDKLVAIETVIGLNDDLMREAVPSLYLRMKPEKYGYTNVKNDKGEFTKEHDATVMGVRKALGEEGIPRYYKYLEELLGDNPFFAGSDLTIADLDVLPRINWFGKGNLDGVKSDNLDSFPKLKAWHTRVQAIPAIAKWYESH